MRTNDLETRIGSNQERLEELKRFDSGKESLEEVSRLQEEIDADLKELEISKIDQDINAIDEQSPLSKAVEDALKEEIGIPLLEQKLTDDAQKLAQEIIESEKKVLLSEKYSKLMAGISLDSLDEERAQDITRRMRFIESIDDVQEKNYDAQVILESLCDTEGNLEIKKALVSDFTDSIPFYSLSKIVNVIAEEDPSFESSEELYRVKKSVAMTGIRELSMFRYFPVDLEPEIYLDEWNTSVDKKKESIIELSKTRDSVESLDQFKEVDKQELAKVLLATLSSEETFSPYRREFHSDLIKNAAERLGVLESETTEAVKTGFIATVTEGIVPTSLSMDAFPDSTRELREVLGDSEKRGEIMKSVFERTRKGKINPQGWGEFSSFIEGSAEDRKVFLENFADCSEKTSYQIEDSVFKELKKAEGQSISNLSDQEKTFVFDRISSEVKSQFLTGQIDYDFNMERYGHLPFTETEVKRSVISRFSKQGVHTSFYDNELERIIKNISNHFPQVELSAEQVKDKIFKEQIFSYRENNIYVDSISRHVEHHHLSFDAQELEERKDQITKLFSSVVAKASVSGFADVKDLEAIFGPSEKYTTPFQVYDAIKHRFLNPENEDEEQRNVLFSDMKEVLSFVPKQYKLDILTNPEWQKKIGSMYEDYLVNPSHSWEHRTTGKDIGFMISKTETYESAERSAYLKLTEDNNLHDMAQFLSKLNTYRPQSPTVSELKKHIDNHADIFIQDSKNLSALWGLGTSLPGIREKVMHHTQESLTAIVPTSSISNDELRNLFAIRYGRNNLGDEDYYASSTTKLEMYTRHFKDSKSFLFYEKMDASYSLYQGGAWDGVYEKIAGMDDERSEGTLALLDMLTQKSPKNFSEVADFCRLRNLPEMEGLFEGLQAENELNSLGISPDVIQRNFSKFIGQSLEEQKISVIIERCNDLIHRGYYSDEENYEELLRILAVIDIPEEKVTEVLFQRAGQYILQNNMESLRTMWNYFPNLKEKFGYKSINDVLIGQIQTELNQSSSIENKEVKLEKLEHLKKSFWVTEQFDKLPDSVQENIKSLEGNYSDKGKHLVALAIAAHGIENEARFTERMASIEKVLAFHNPENIPEGAGVTFGIEYEVGRSIGEEYIKNSHLGYVSDIQSLNVSCDIKSGGGGHNAIHEIATKPTTNPYLLLAEVKLLQDAEMLDLNFKKYPDAPRGYHLNIGGESGLNAKSGDMNFLYNTLTMTGCAGLLMGKEVSSVKEIHSKSLDAIGDKRQGGNRVEFKGMGGDSFEQFERTVLTAYHAGVASQLQDKYLGNISEEAIKNLPDSSEQFESALSWNSEKVATQQEKEIILQWVQLKKDMILAIEEHNNSFLEGEFYGSLITPNGDYKEFDLDNNYGRKRTIYFGDEKIDLEKEQEKYIIKSSLFQKMTTDFVNTLTRSNNLLIFKEPILQIHKFDEKTGRLKDQWMGNAPDVLTTMQAEGYRKNIPGSPFTSIFEREGEIRDGYYPIQGTSEEMITHKSQILLSRFNKKVESLLRNNQPVNSTLQQARYETV